MRTGNRVVGVAAFALLMLVVTGLLGIKTAAAGTCPMQMSSRKYKVKVDSAPAGATIYLDSKECGAVGVTPWSGTLAAGSYTVIVELAGYEATQKPIKVARTRTLQETTLALVKLPEPPRLDIRADADKNVFDAQVFLDGQNQGKVPLILVTTPGRHQLVFKKEGFEPFEQWVEVAANEKATISPVLKEIPKPKFGTIVVEADVAGAEVYVDGNKHPDTTPTVISNVVEGLHVIEVRKEPAMPWKVTVQVVATQQSKVRAELASTIGGPKGAVRVITTPATAHVFLDGTDRGEASQGLDLKDLTPGEHIIEVRAAGYQTKEQRVTVSAGSSEIVKVDLPLLAPTDQGTLKVIASATGASVVIDGAVAGTTPQELKVSAGEHFVKVQLAGYKTFETKITVKAGETATVQADLKAATQLRVISNPPGASVMINGLQASGQTPLDTELDAGTTVVRIELDGFEPQERTLNLEGGKSEIVSVTLERSTASDAERAAEQKGLSSLGARTLPRGRSTVDFGAGFPYFLNLRVAVGAGRVKNFGMDAAVEVRTMLSRTELGLGTRLMLVNHEPFSLAAFGDLWWGSKLLDDSKRNGLTFSTGIAASLTALTNVTVTGRAWLDFWSDRHCPEVTAGGEFDGDATDSCTAYKAFLDGSNPGFMTDAQRMQDLTGLTGAEMFGRDGGARFNLSISAELALRQHWNAWFTFEGAPFQGERALYTDLFSAPMFKSDYGTYGRVGLTYKF